MSLITYQFQDLCNNSISNLMLQDEFKTKLNQLFTNLSSKSLRELTKIITIKDHSSNSSLDLRLMEKIFAFTVSCLEQLPQENCKEFQQELDKIRSLNCKLNEKFEKWQGFFKKLLAQYQKQLEESIWLAYLKEQKSKALDLSNNKEIKGGFDAFTYQALAELPLRRLGALIFELLSGLANGCAYISSEGKHKLFMNEVENPNSLSTPNSSGEEGLKNIWKSVTGSEHLPISTNPRRPNLT